MAENLITCSGVSIDDWGNELDWTIKFRPTQECADSGHNSLVFAILFFYIAIALGWGCVTLALEVSRLLEENAQNRMNVANFRNTPTHTLHKRIEEAYRKQIGIKTTHLRHAPRYPVAASCIDNMITMTRSITIVENLEFYMPPPASSGPPPKLLKKKMRKLKEDDEEAMMLLQQLGLLENDSTLQPRRGNRSTGIEPPAYEDGRRIAREGWVNQ